MLQNRFTPQVPKRFFCFCMIVFLFFEIRELSFMKTKLRQQTEKRHFLNKKDAEELLKPYLPDMFKAYEEGLAGYNQVIRQFNPLFIKKIDSGILNSKISESFYAAFPDNFINAKYGRVIFRWEGVQIMIKKLNPNGKPSYVPTLLSESIINQEQAPLFKGDELAQSEPLLFFGYTKDKNGEIVNPRLVYYDSEVKWTIDRSTSGLVAETTQTTEVEVRLKQQEKEAE